jgi:hypothetical protein
MLRQRPQENGLAACACNVGVSGGISGDGAICFFSTFRFVCRGLWGPTRCPSCDLSATELHRDLIAALRRR